jgi:large subunit ribosomal protein L11
MSEAKKNPQPTLNKFNVYVVVGAAMGASNLPPVLGPKGINLKLFVDEFNKVSKGLKSGIKVSANVAYQKGGKFSILKLKSISVPLMIKDKISLKAGSQKPGINIVAEMSMKDAEEIAAEKMVDMNAFSKESALKTVIGTARSMGVKIV